ncbi:hypothetical protein GMORB2_4535 [Geosmithia morbida]|uniref:Uncharacterized protein n=1 Tax=Geosmithia morbida TaxID=1094350 RepID=A0A9P5D0N7_9HYPO|nr:uncharacterized protein GMORB2_4535 [Geosmithia morbida]KAF4119626.1 hypothetical protein GMORB2_4535 [Geosmithia morbida]
MFHIPDAKRIRREDLVSPDNSDSDGDDDQIRAQLHAQLERTLGLDLGAHPLTPDSPPKPARQAEQEQGQGRGPNDDDGDDRGERDADQAGYDFCLFAGEEASANKVILEDDGGPKGEGAIIAPRPSSYYVGAKLTAEEKAAAAVTGDDILARSGWRAWSMEMPWKVTHVTVTRKGGAVVGEHEAETDGTTTGTRRTRVGKKRRIALRLRERAERSRLEEAARKEEEARKRLGEKEDHLREKKKRLNRVKKLRKRQKERERKIAAGEAVPDEADEAEVSDSE